MLSHRRCVTYLICLATCLAAPAGALAKTHAARARKVTGVVVAINSERHTLKLRVHRSAGARKATAAAARGGIREFSFGDATVHGAHGAVVVGDDVTVTTTSSSGQGSGVAATIAVIGQPNGGDAGKGAAIAGRVTAVDPTSGTLTIAAGSSLLHVSVTPTTILAVADANGSGPITLASIAVGDHVIVFTDDATADPVVAVGILDSGSLSGAGNPTAQTHVSFGGAVQSIDMAGSTLTVKVLKGPRAGTVVTVAVNSSTQLDGASHSDEAAFSHATTTDESAFTLADINVGDLVSVSAATLDSDPIVALGVYDAGQPDDQPSGDGSGGDSGAGSPPPSGDAPTVRFAATVSAVGTDGLTVTAINGPLSGQSVRVSVTSTTSFELLNVAADIAQLQADVAVGDTVEVYTHAETTTPIVAVGLIDYGANPA